jgi:Papain family cysteine protease
VRGFRLTTHLCSARSKPRQLQLTLALASLVLSGVTVPLVTQTAAAATAVHGLGALAPTTTIFPTTIAPSAAVALPVSADISQWDVPVGDQGSVGSCVAWTIAHSMMGWYATRAGLSPRTFSPMYMYSQINVGESQLKDLGSHPTYGLAEAVSQGNDSESDYWQGDINWGDPPNASERNNANGFKLTGYTTLFANPSGGGSIGEDAIKTAIANTQPVAIMLPVRPGFDSLTATNTLDTDQSGKSRGLHEVLAVGYNSYGLLIQNQWGTGWGSGGYARLAWNVVRGDIIEAEVATGLIFNATWYLKSDNNPVSSASTALTYGIKGDIPVMGDWDGNGTDTPGVFRNGVWYLSNGVAGHVDITTVFGEAGDRPVVGDWTGTGHDGIGVVRNASWYLRDSPTSSSGQPDHSFVWGLSTDIPLVGKWSGGKADGIGLLRGSTWYFSNSATVPNASASVVWGVPGDVPVVGDWTKSAGSAEDTIGIFRNGTWLLSNSNRSPTAAITEQFGQEGDVALSGSSASGDSTPAVLRVGH